MHKTPQCWTIFGNKMSKKYTPLWHEVYLEIKIRKVPHVLLEKVHAVVAQSTLRIKLLKPPRFGPLLEIRISLRFLTIYYIILHRTTSRTTTLPTLHHTSLHPTKRNNTTPQFTSPHCTTFHYTSLQEKKPHYATVQLQLHSTTLYYTTLH